MSREPTSEQFQRSQRLFYHKAPNPSNAINNQSDHCVLRMGCNASLLRSTKGRIDRFSYDGFSRPHSHFEGERNCSRNQRTILGGSELCEERDGRQTVRKRLLR